MIATVVRSSHPPPRLLGHARCMAEVTGRLGIWQLEGVEDYATLLPYALSKENWASSMVVVVLDLSKPWTLEASALKWLGLVQQAWEALHLSPGERDELQEKGECRTHATDAVA